MNNIMKYKNIPGVILEQHPHISSIHKILWNQEIKVFLLLQDEWVLCDRSWSIKKSNSYIVEYITETYVLGTLKPFLNHKELYLWMEQNGC